MATATKIKENLTLNSDFARMASKASLAKVTNMASNANTYRGQQLSWRQNDMLQKYMLVLAQSGTVLTSYWYSPGL